MGWAGHVARNEESLWAQNLKGHEPKHRMFFISFFISNFLKEYI
jgi:hypothetical protein